MHIRITQFSRHESYLYITIYASNLIQSELHLGVACDETTPLIEFFLLKSSSCMFVQETRNKQVNPSIVASIALLIFYYMSYLFI